jgi:uncharacterized membrane protein
MKKKTPIIIMILLLAVPNSVFAATSFILQAKAEGNVVILSHTIYQTYGSAPFSVDKGDYTVAGEVQNNGEGATHFNITTNFYDSDNNLIVTKYLTDSYTETPPSFLHVLLPDKKSPFAIYLSRYDETGNFRLIDHYTLQVSTSQTNAFHTGFEIISQTSHTDGGTLYVEGEVRNIGSYYIDGVMVFGTFYNETGEVVAVTSEGGGYIGPSPSPNETGFPPNETTQFYLKIDDFDGKLQKINRYELTAEGYDYALTTNEGQIINPEVDYVLGVVPEPEQPNQPNQTEAPPIGLYAAIAAAIAILLIASLLLMRRRRKKDPAAHSDKLNLRA